MLPLRLLPCLLFATRSPTQEQTPAPATGLLARALAGDRDAASALRRQGAAALPALRAQLADRDWWPRASAQQATWIADLLIELGPAAAPAFDDVVRAYGDSEKASSPEVSAALLRVLRRAAPFAADRAEELEAALSERVLDLGPRFHIAVQCVRAPAPANLGQAIGQLRNEPPCDRIVAAQFLARGAKTWTSDERTQALSALRTAAGADLPRQIRVRYRHARAPGQITVKFALPARHHELAIARALASLGCQDPLVLPALRHRLRHFDSTVRVEAVQAIAQLGADAAAAVPELVKLAKWLTPEGAEAVTALGMIGVREPHVLQALRVAARSSDRQLSTRARAALRQLGEAVR